jgi:hypothetical protein
MAEGLLLSATGLCQTASKARQLRPRLLAARVLRASVVTAAGHGNPGASTTLDGVRRPMHANAGFGLIWTYLAPGVVTGHINGSLYGILAESHSSYLISAMHRCMHAMPCKSGATVDKG